MISLVSNYNILSSLKRVQKKKRKEELPTRVSTISNENGYRTSSETDAPSLGFSAWIHSKEEVSDCFPQLKNFLLLINSNQLPPNPKTQIEVIQLICHLNNKPLHPAGLHHGVDLGLEAQWVLTHCLVKDEEGSIGPFKAGGWQFWLI